MGIKPPTCVDGIVGNDVVCLGTSNSFKTFNTGGIWSSSNTTIASISTSGVLTPFKEGTITLHCNIKLTNCEGGEPFIEEEKIVLNKGDMLIYPVSVVQHGSHIVTGTIPRMIWTFGFSITPKDYNRIFIEDNWAPH